MIDRIRKGGSDGGEKSALAGNPGSKSPAEPELRPSDDRLKLLVENTKDYGVVIADPSGRVLEWHGGAERITGFAAADVVGKSAELIFTPEDRAARVAEKEMAKAAATGRAEDKRWHMRRDGSRFYADGVMTALYSDDGKLRGFGKVFRDATAQKQAEDALRQSEYRLQFALKAGRMGTWELNLDTRQLDCSPQCKASYGRAENERFSYDDLATTVIEEDRDRFQRALEDAADRGLDFDVEYRVRWPDGSVHWVYVRASCILHRGRVIVISGVLLNIDERKRAEQRLRLLDAIGEATRSAADPAAVMAATTRLVGEHLRVTRCAYADVETDNNRFTIRDDWNMPGASSTVGVYSLDLFGSGPAADLRAGRTLVVRDVDRELPPDDGASMFNSIGIKATVCCPLTKDGHLVALMAVHQSAPREWREDEISIVREVVDRSWAHIERVRAAEALREQDRRKDEFLATLAHELRNPLAPIRTGLQVLQVTPSGPNAERARAMMERQLAHMVRLIDDLLDVSRISRGKFELKRQRIALQSVIEHAVEASRPAIESAGHELVVSAPEDPIWVEGDLTRLAQVASNLLNNSAKYTPNGGLIAIRAGTENGAAVLRVTDNGVGIAAKVLPEVFDLFAQVNRTIHRAQGGLGIGLSLVRKLTEMHGGTVAAESEGEGRGSTFTVTLPLMSDERIGATAARESSNCELEAAEAVRRILVVDDNVDGAEMLATMLELSGHRTKVAHDGLQALAAARDFSPEIVFLDIGLPGMDGCEVARRFRADPALSQMVLIALTGWGSDDDKRRTKQAGFDFHLTKPVQTSVVSSLIGEL